jgi:hypothetical protein
MTTHICILASDLSEVTDLSPARLSTEHRVEVRVLVVFLVSGVWSICMTGAHDYRGIRAGPSDRSASLSVFERLPTRTEEQVSRAAKAAASRAGENSWENELENATSGINLGCAK